MSYATRCSRTLLTRDCAPRQARRPSFVAGVDLDVRARAARKLGWKPITQLIREIHNGDASLRDRWPTEYWTMEPFDAKRRDRLIRYAAAFRLTLDAFLAFALT